MNKLQLCVKLREKADIAGSGPTTTASQTGEYARIVGWIEEAYEQVQNESSHWLFMRDDFALSMSEAVAEYATTEVDYWGEWLTDDFRVYLDSVDDESLLTYVPWDAFRVSYMVGTSRTVEGRPSVFTVKPDGTLRFYPTPDDDYTCVGEYRKTAVTMDSDTDEPVFPDRHHMAVVWGGLMLYAAEYAEPDKFAMGRSEYNAIIKQMKRTQLPKMTWPGALV